MVRRNKTAVNIVSWNLVSEVVKKVGGDLFWESSGSCEDPGLLDVEKSNASGDFVASVNEVVVIVVGQQDLVLSLWGSNEFDVALTVIIASSFRDGLVFSWMTGYVSVGKLASGSVVLSVVDSNLVDISVWSQGVMGLDTLTSLLVGDGIVSHYLVPVSNESGWLEVVLLSKSSWWVGWAYGPCSKVAPADTSPTEDIRRAFFTFIEKLINYYVFKSTRLIKSSQNHKYILLVVLK